MSWRTPVPGRLRSAEAASALSARSEHQVVDVMGSRPALGHGTGTLFVDLDLPVLIQERGDHRRPDIVSRVETAVDVCRASDPHYGKR